MSVRVRHRFTAAATTLLATLFLGGCEINTRMSTFDTRGPVAESQLDLFMVTVWVTLFIFIVVGGALLWSVIRFRERPNDTRPPPSQGHGNPLVEVSLIGASILLLVIIAVPTLRAIWYTQDTPDDPPSHLGEWYPREDYSEDAGEEVLNITVTGYQWWWEFEYPQLGVTTANEMIIPAGKTVHLELRSMDVIHSFWLPKIAGKVDLIPGRTNHMWIRAGNDFATWREQSETEGEGPRPRAAYNDYLREEIDGYYYGQCAEYCGESHARMLFRARVVDENEFADWVGEQKEGHEAPGDRNWEEWYETYDENPEQLTGDINEGLKLFMGRARCATCHVVEGNPRAVGVAGPDLTKVASRRSIAAGWLEHKNPDGSVDVEQQYDNFFRWIKKTDEIKPGNLMWEAEGGGIGELDKPLTDEEIHKITRYLQTLE